MGEPVFGRAKRMDKRLALELYERGYIDTQIAVRCGVAPTTVQSWRKRNGLRAHRKQRKYVPQQSGAASLESVVAEAKAHKMSYGQYVVAKMEGKV